MSRSISNLLTVIESSRISLMLIAIRLSIFCSSKGKLCLLNDAFLSAVHDNRAIVCHKIYGSFIPKRVHICAVSLQLSYHRYEEGAENLLPLCQP